MQINIGLKKKIDLKLIFYLVHVGFLFLSKHSHVTTRLKGLDEFKMVQKEFWKNIENCGKWGHFCS